MLEVVPRPGSIAACETLACPESSRLTSCDSELKQKWRSACYAYKTCLTNCSISHDSPEEEVACRTQHCTTPLAGPGHNLVHCIGHAACANSMLAVRRRGSGDGRGSGGWRRHGSDQQPSIGRKGSTLRSLRVAVLYSGRFFGTMTQSWFDNHLEFLIAPNNASIFLGIDCSNWCSIPQHAAAACREQRWSDASATLHRQVQKAFRGWADMHVAVHAGSMSIFPKQRAFAALQNCSNESVAKYNPNQRRLGLAAFVMTSWLRQYRHVADTEALRRTKGPHDIIVRARLDVLFLEPLHLLYHSTYTAISTLRHVLTVQRKNEVALASGYVPWRDWVYVGTAEAMEVLAQMGDGPILVRDGPLSPTTRNVTELQKHAKCYGLAPESQNELQFHSRGFRLQPLPAQVMLVRLEPSALPNGSYHHKFSGGPCTQRSMEKPNPNDR